MRVSDWMTKDVKAVRETESLQDAAMSMWSNDLGTLPVLAEDGRVLGMITDRDIAMAAALRRRPLDVVDVRATMSKQLWTCGPDDTLAEAEAAMREHQVRRLPVVDAAGHLVGMLSLNDIAHAALTGPKKILASNIARTLDAISTPRPGLVSMV